MQHGAFSLADMRMYTDIAAEVMAQYGYCLMLVDSKDAGSLDAEARRYIAHWSVGKPIIGIAAYNASLTPRALFTLVLKAMNLIGRQPLPFSFFKTEPEARVWLTQLRQQHLSKAKPGTAPRVPG